MNKYGLSPLKIASTTTKLSNKDVIEYVKNNLSEYSATKENGREILSEVFQVFILMLLMTLIWYN